MRSLYRRVVGWVDRWCHDQDVAEHGYARYCLCDECWRGRLRETRDIWYARQQSVDHIAF